MVSLLAYFLILPAWSISVGAVKPILSDVNNNSAINIKQKLSQNLYDEFARLELENVDLSKEKFPVWI